MQDVDVLGTAQLPLIIFLSKFLHPRFYFLFVLCFSQSFSFVTVFLIPMSPDFETRVDLVCSVTKVFDLSHNIHVLSNGTSNLYGVPNSTWFMEHFY